MTKENKQETISYWITTQWPPRENQVERRSGIWLKDGLHEVGRSICVGDLVLVYELKNGKKIEQINHDGTRLVLKRQKGRMGIIHLASVTGVLDINPESEPQTYEDGTTIWWRWYAPTKILDRSGFLSQEKVALALGYKPKYTFRGFGKQKSGLKALSPKQFELLYDQFRASAQNAATVPDFD